MARIAETEGQRRTTLFLCAVLHAFTHLYPTVLPPLYYQVARDLELSGVWLATLLVSAQSLAYCLAGWPLGFLADRVSRKWLMFWGLAINGAAFVALGLAPSYTVALLCLVIAGLAGGAYHPPATALLTGLYPERQGRAIGLAGMGAGVGFFLGPFYGGLRGEVAGWRAPCLELGLAGLAVAILFALLARDAPAAKKQAVPAAGPAFVSYFILLSVGLGLRDFAGTGFTTFAALFLPQAHGFSQRTTGLYLGLMSLSAVAANPFYGAASDGRYRLWWAGGVLLLAGLGGLALPWLPKPLVLLGLLWWGFFLLGSYPITEAAMSEVLPDQIRGRAFGVFLTSSGLLSSAAPWVMGTIKDRAIGASTDPAAFRPAFAGLALLMLLSVLIGMPLLRWVRRELARMTARDGCAPDQGCAPLAAAGSKRPPAS